MMVPCSEVKALIRDVFEEEALALGGMVALHEVEDDLVWRLVRTMDVIRKKALRRLNACGPEEHRRRPIQARRHPAIEHFLAVVRQ